MRYCENCGKPLSDDDVFCTECGNRINEYGETISSSPNIPKSEIVDGATASFSEEVQGHPIPDQAHPWEEDEPINDSSASEEPLYEDSPPPRKHKHKSHILPICVAILVLAVGGFALWKFVLSSDSPQTSTPSSNPAVSISSEDNSALSNGSSALSSSSESETSNSSEVLDSEPSDSSQAEDNDSLLQVAERAISDGDYPTAIRVMEYILEDDPQNDTVARSLEQIKDTYKNSVLEDANGYVNQGRQDEAISVLNEAKAVLGDSAEINLLLSAIQSNSTPNYQSSPSTPTPTPYSPPAYYYPQNNYYILPQSSDRLLTYQYIAGLSQQDLMLARNEIFARHGRIFNDPDVRNYFESQIWYYGYIEPEDFTDTMLSDIEKDNIAFIQEYENAGE